MNTKGSSTPLLEADFQGNGQREASPIPLTLIFSTLSAVFGSYAFGFAIAYSSPTQSGIMHDLDLALNQYSSFGSILTVGAMIGATVSGRIADYAGRRVAMGMSEVFCILGSLIIAFSKVAWWLYLGRLLIGCGIGVISYVVPVYVAEITPKNLRGTFTAVHELLSLPFIPDSPRWQAKVGRLKESESALQRLRGKNADVYQEATEIRDYTEALQRQTEASIIGLFQLHYLKSLTVGVGLMMLQQFGGFSGILFYTNSIFTSAGFSDSIGTIAMVAVKIPATTLGVFLMDKCGRRPLLLASAIGTCLGSFLAALSFFLKDLHERNGISPIMALVGVLVYMGSFTLGLAGIPWVIMSELRYFPLM
ncbi:sugar transporter ERD6-like 5 [Cajanus cajan]|uniref:sugar transporter ERD6-like 5 n=1 Tax=Cajanus cajan TaxID=3821 RepID=UPI00098D89A2|nr:sugar transporter ERD6-like 5 [Cajanus cajan]